MQSPYSVSKLAHHPERVQAFRRGEVPPPVQVHLMPSNTCSHACTWCSYRLQNDDGTKTWKNSAHFDDKVNVPWDLMQRTLRELRAMGTKAIELTGGGEPFIYPKIDALIELIDELGFDLGIVSHGAAITAARAQVIGQVRGWKWARISIDAGKVETYAAARSVSPMQWDRAWNAVEKLAEARDLRGDPEIMVGVGFVVSRENFDQVFQFCKIAKEHGADNVRLSLRFGPEGNDFFSKEQLDVAESQAARAQAEFDDDHFLVVNLIPERRANQDAPVQDYEPCYTMRSLCVIGGDSKVYTCCTLAFDPRGLIGDLKEKSFTEIWDRRFFDRFSVKKQCAVQCLYEKRNKAMIAIVEGPDGDPGPRPPHVDFI